MRSIKLLVVLFGLITTFSTCKKSSSGVPNSLTASVGAANFKFNSQISGNSLGNGFRIKGKDYDNSPTSFELTLTDGSPLSARTYTENSTVTPSVQITFVWYINLLGIIVGTTTYAGYVSPTMPIVVNITEATSSSVTGTFAGELKAVGSTDKIIISNGQFHFNF